MDRRGRVQASRRRLDSIPVPLRPPPRPLLDPPVGKFEKPILDLTPKVLNPKPYRSLFISYDFAKAPPGLVNHDLVQIPIACVSVSSALALFSASLWSAANRRSRGLLLGSLLGLLLVYTAAATVMSLFLSKQPLETIGARAMAMSQSCPSRATTSELTTQCALAKGHQAQVADANSHLLWVGCVGVSVAAVILIGVGIWYTFELAFIEKKAAKHLRRHRRRKSQIPWHKIKVGLGLSMTPLNSDPRLPQDHGSGHRLRRQEGSRQGVSSKMPCDAQLVHRVFK